MVNYGNFVVLMKASTSLSLKEMKQRHMVIHIHEPHLLAAFIDWFLHEGKEELQTSMQVNIVEWKLITEIGITIYKTER